MPVLMLVLVLLCDPVTADVVYSKLLLKLQNVPVHQIELVFFFLHLSYCLSDAQQQQQSARIELTERKYRIHTQTVIGRV